MKEIEALDKWRSMSCLQIEKCNIKFMSILPKLIQAGRFNVILIKIPAEFFEDTEKLILTFILKGKATRIAKRIWKKTTKVGGIVSLYFKIYFKATVSNTVWYWQGPRDTKQTESPETDSHKHDQLIFFHKSTVAIKWRKNSLFKKCQND